MRKRVEIDWKKTDVGYFRSPKTLAARKSEISAAEEGVKTRASRKSKKGLPDARSDLSNSKLFTKSWKGRKKGEDQFSAIPKLITSEVVTAEPWRVKKEPKIARERAIERATAVADAAAHMKEVEAAVAGVLKAHNRLKKALKKGTDAQ